MKIIDIETWKRKEHFKHFCSLDDPFWSMVTELDCSETYLEAKRCGYSFFLSYLHKSALAAQQVEEFRYRIEDGQVVCHDILHASATVLREDETFGCCFIEFKENFADFVKNAKVKIAETKSRSGMCLDENELLSQIHYSSIPWCRFSSLTTAKNLKPQDSVPKISFGKRSEVGGRHTIPIAIHVHHALIDGIHVAKYLELFQKLLSKPEVAEKEVFA